MTGADLILAGIVAAVAVVTVLLCPEYWPDQANRDLRDVWMLRVDGKLSGAEAEPCVELARRLSASLTAFCADEKLDAGTEVTSMFEGR